MEKKGNSSSTNLLKNKVPVSKDYYENVIKLFYLIRGKEKFWWNIRCMIKIKTVKVNSVSRNSNQTSVVLIKITHKTIFK